MSLDGIEMKHLFRFSRNTKDELSQAINRRLANVRMSRYGNEPNYAPAMIQELNGFEFENAECKVAMKGAVMTGVAPGATENWSGADCSVVARIEDKHGCVIDKAILAQCKRESVKKLQGKIKEKLEEQIGNMRKLTKHPKLIELPERDGEVPRVISACGYVEGTRLQHQDFGRWVATRVLPTLDGDTRKDFAKAVLDSKLSKLRIHAVKKA